MDKTKREKTSPLGTLCNALGTVLVVLVIALLLPLLVLKVTGGNAFEITSGSMEPEIPVGSLVVVKHIDASEAAEGDIIAFESGGSIVVHRVTENDADARELITKGDANEIEDLRPVAYEDLIGIVTHHFDGAGAVLGYLTGQSGKIILLCLIGCGVLLQIVGRGMKRA